ncbi:MAG: protein-L-isoaspartate(D-aspartate) O-methyltransferase [Roseiflexaceae bacterium]|nr:protein-L-isoaspartate(D-aspartate) O-methyltransferase [Roseiflexaceae bacterium]
MIEQQRQAMVREQLQRRGITDTRVLAAMERVPRHRFLPADAQEKAYADRALPIAEGQTISQPYIVALMAQALLLRGDERLLEIGAGSGYAAAVLSLLAADVVAIERIPTLAAAAEERLISLGYINVRVLSGDGTAGLPGEAPFDAISVAAASPWVPRPLREQLARDGRLVIPVGGRDEQRLLRITRTPTGERLEQLSGVRFVPLLGKHAWGEHGAR